MITAERKQITALTFKSGGSYFIMDLLYSFVRFNHQPNAETEPIVEIEVTEDGLLKVK